MAFLACFSRSESDYVIPLKSGANRVARSTTYGDHEALPNGARLLESRQWRIDCTGEEARVADDRTTNLSVVIPRDFDGDRSTPYGKMLKPDPAAHALLRPAVPLDWGGEITCTLHPGDVIRTCYASFVFGRCPLHAFGAGAQSG